MCVPWLLCPPEMLDGCWCCWVIPGTSSRTPSKVPGMPQLQARSTTASTRNLCQAGNATWFLFTIWDKNSMGYPIKNRWRAVKTSALDRIRAFIPYNSSRQAILENATLTASLRYTWYLYRHAPSGTIKMLEPCSPGTRQHTVLHMWWTRGN